MESMVSCSSNGGGFWEFLVAIIALVISILGILVHVSIFIVTRIRDRKTYLVFKQMFEDEVLTEIGIYLGHQKMLIEGSPLKETLMNYAGAMENEQAFFEKFLHRSNLIREVVSGGEQGEQARLAYAYQEYIRELIKEVTRSRERALLYLREMERTEVEFGGGVQRVHREHEETIERLRILHENFGRILGYSKEEMAMKSVKHSRRTVSSFIRNEDNRKITRFPEDSDVVQFECLEWVESMWRKAIKRKKKGTR